MKKIFLLTLFLILTACSDSEKVFTPLAEDAVILAFGDSLTYGTGVSKDKSYPTILEQLSGRKVVNEGISGEITATGLQRLPHLLDEIQPELLILIHGGNDILRKIDREKTAANLTQMIAEAKQRDIKVVMLGVPKFGLLFLESAAIYQQVAELEQVPIDLKTLPDILTSKSLKSDAVHPNAEGYKVMAENIFELLQQSGAL